MDLDGVKVNHWRVVASLTRDGWNTADIADVLNLTTAQVELMAKVITLIVNEAMDRYDSHRSR